MIMCENCCSPETILIYKNNKLCKNCVACGIKQKNEIGYTINTPINKMLKNLKRRITSSNN